jgi:hypothetical protein
MHATHANRPEMQCKYDRSVQGKFQLPVCQDHNSQLYYRIPNDIFFQSYYHQTRKYMNNDTAPEISKLGMYCMNISNQADNPRILPSYMHP